MQKTDTIIEGCFILEPKIFKDNRGYFYESFNQQSFEQLTSISTPFVQDNQVSSTFGVTRGLHLQRPPHSQAKLVRALQGKIIDVAVDVRKNSPSYGKVVAVELSDENHKQLYVPHGCLHGYSVISETALVMYKCDNFYNKESEDSVHPFDMDLKVDWQLKMDEAILSDKDKIAQAFKNFNPIELS